MKLYVDDYRAAPDVSWITVANSENAILLLKLLADNGTPVTELALDHDLGQDGTGDEDTTRPIILWLCQNPSYWPRDVKVHSANPVGVEWLEGMISRYKPPTVHCHGKRVQ